MSNENEIKEGTPSPKRTRSAKAKPNLGKLEKYLTHAERANLKATLSQIHLLVERPQYRSVGYGKPPEKVSKAFRHCLNQRDYRKFAEYHQTQSLVVLETLWVPEGVKKIDFDAIYNETK